MNLLKKTNLVILHKKIQEELPEKVIQFGTGVLLRGLPDYFINKANEQNLFNGKIIVVKSTDGKLEGQEQDFLYTQVIKGIEKGRIIEETNLNYSISRVLSASLQWEEVLKTAKKPQIQIVISNTTEVGLKYTEESIFQTPPTSFPAKLTAWLLERSKNALQVNPIVIIPTELISNNGAKLKEIILKLIDFNHIGNDFKQWIHDNCIFCNSLVDRIVPGKPKNEQELQEIYQKLGYIDEQLIMSEAYALWAIEGNEDVQRILSFSKTDERVIITHDINPYKERKLRLLNGTHTISVPLAFLKGLNTIYEAMSDKEISNFFTKVALEEISPTIPIKNLESVKAFGEEVLDRFRNPYIVHQLIDITFQSTMKMKMRNVATIQRYYEKFNKAPLHIAKGFAAYLLFMRAIEKVDNQYFGNRRGEKYPIIDDSASYFYELWQKVDIQKESSVLELAKEVLSNQMLWDTDLTLLNGFLESVVNELLSLLRLPPKPSQEVRLESRV
jgi:tagaturonate reductase